MGKSKRTKMDNDAVLNDFLKMNVNWDNDGASKISKTAIGTASAICNKVSIQPFIAPLKSGGVQLEWEWNRNTNHECYLEFEIQPDGSIHHFEYAPRHGICSYPEDVSEAVDIAEGFFISQNI